MPETVQHLDAVRIGHFRLELGTTQATAINFGAVNNAVLKYITTNTTLEFDNTGEVMEVVDDETIEITGDIGEISIEALDLVNKGLATVEDQAGESTTVTDELVTLNDTSAVRLAHKMGVLGEVTITYIRHLTDTPVYVRNTDYVASVDNDGYTTIARIAAGAITDGQTVEVKYDYTPLVSKKIFFGGKSQKTYLWCKCTHVKKGVTPELGWSFVMPKVKVEGGFEIKFPAIKKTEAMVSPIKLTAIRDTTLTIGKQLIEITDEQRED